MRFVFHDKKLRLAYEQRRSKDHSPEVLKVFLRRMQAIKAAAGTNDLTLPGLHYHPLKGDLKGKWSMRLTGNMRLIVEPLSDDEGEYLLIRDICDYH